MRTFLVLIPLLIGCSLPASNPYAELDREFDRVMDLVQNPDGLNCQTLRCNTAEEQLLREYWGQIASWKVLKVRKVAWKRFSTVEVVTKGGKTAHLQVNLEPTNGAIAVGFWKN